MRTQRQQAEEDNPETSRLELMQTVELEMNNLMEKKRQARQ